MIALDLMTLLGPAAIDAEWEAEKAGWRAFVMGNTGCCHRPGSRLARAFQRGYDAAERSDDAVGLML
ncbi:hypothetical protein J2Y58_003999 [Sphingomonas sp. BE138]|mgnify:CR=1 FL=1|uniref:hypothetical protein n=1 Tax=Sphingomonas sp. BE138 TaxID=2817845 RepID=UPI002863EAB9|nr:hypothetical protein [Sphingomonas sp. BE138]MDR6790616.1 hypothetical protein [Sphingomonas sp. BE138]